MEKNSVLTFFRLFDVAFFAPGVVVVGSLVIGKVGVFEPSAIALGADTASGILLLVGLLAAAYVAGLLVHGLQRVIGVCLPRVFRAPRLEASEWCPWFLRLPESERRELAVYWWYLRTTCWNVAVAVAIGGLVLVLSRCGRGNPTDWPASTISTICALAAIVILVLAGRDFAAASRAALPPMVQVRKSPSNNDNVVQVRAWPSLPAGHHFVVTADGRDCDLGPPAADGHWVNFRVTLTGSATPTRITASIVGPIVSQTLAE